MSHSKHEAPKGFLYGAWAVTAVTGFAFALLAGFGIYNATQSQIEASNSFVQVNPDQSQSQSSLVQTNPSRTASATATSGECSGTKIAINNYPGDALAKEKTNKFFLDAMGGKNYRCTNVCNNSGKSNDEFIKSLKIGGQPVNTVNTGAELVTMVQQEPTKVASTVVLSSTKNECQGPISEEYAGLTDGNGDPVGVWKKNTTGEETAKQQAAAQSGTEIQEAARPAEGGTSTGLKVGTSGEGGTSKSETSGAKTSTASINDQLKACSRVVNDFLVYKANDNSEEIKYIRSRYQDSKRFVYTAKTKLAKCKAAQIAMLVYKEKVGQIQVADSPRVIDDHWSGMRKADKARWPANVKLWRADFNYTSKTKSIRTYAYYIPTSIDGTSGYWSLSSSGKSYKQSLGSRGWVNYDPNDNRKILDGLVKKSKCSGICDLTKEKPDYPNGFPNLEASSF